MMKRLKGKRITKEQAYEGLGDIETWVRDKETILKEFKKKPNVRVSVLFPKQDTVDRKGGCKSLREHQ